LPVKRREKVAGTRYQVDELQCTESAFAKVAVPMLLMVRTQVFLVADIYSATAIFSAKDS